MLPFRLSLWFCLLAATGCSVSFPDAYTGPFRSPNELAVVTGQANSVGEPGYVDVVINSIDGQREVGGWKAPRHEVHLLPGSHTIGLVQAKTVEAAGARDAWSWDNPCSWRNLNDEHEFKDQAVLRFKVIVGARYAVGYNPTTKKYLVVRVGLGPVPFKIVK